MSPVPREWQFGPFVGRLALPERVARLRCLRTIVELHCGPRGTVTSRALHLAETDPDADDLAIGALMRLTPLDRRHVLASYAKISRAP